MIQPSRLLTATVAPIATGTLAFAGPAVAKGGGGNGGATTAPSSSPSVDPCASLVGKTYPDRSVAGEFNLVGIVGGCAVIVFNDDLTHTVEEVQPRPGWTYRADVQNKTSEQCAFCPVSDPLTERTRQLR